MILNNSKIIKDLYLMAKDIIYKLVEELLQKTKIGVFR